MHFSVQFFFFIVTVVACTNANAIAAAAVVPATVPEVVNYPAYQTSYAVSDAQTGDQKQVVEVRDGAVTKGSYSFVQPDGIIRTVIYTVTPTGGFQANVINTGVSPHPASTNPKTTLGAPLKFTAIAAPLNVPVAAPVAIAPAVTPVVQAAPLVPATIPIYRYAPVAYRPIPIQHARLAPIPHRCSTCFPSLRIPLPGFKFQASAGLRWGLGVGRHSPIYG